MRLYACIISTDAKENKALLLSIAEQFSYSIELLEDGILFDVSGLQNLIGDAKKISQKILAEMKKNSISGSIAVANTIETAELLARDGTSMQSGTTPASQSLGHPSLDKEGSRDKNSPPVLGGVAVPTQFVGTDGVVRNNESPSVYLVSPESFPDLPIQNLLIDDDTLNVFSDLGIKSIRDLQQVPKDELITRYGQQFKNILDVIDQKGSRLLTPNVKENKVGWGYNLDFPVDDFEQLIFILNHGLDKLLTETDCYGFSTEQLDLSFKLQNRTERVYEIKTSFPTLEKTFWLKLINLRISLDPPESEIVAINVTSHFTPPRPAQPGLYAVSRPDPERLLLTVNKLKNLVGEKNVGVPVLLDQRVEKAFELDSEAVPEGKELLSNAECGMRNAESLSSESGLSATAKDHSEQDSAFRVPHSAFEKKIPNPVIAFSYFNPPIPADVLVRDKKLIFLRTQYFKGHVTKYSGVWKANSKWWDKSWKAQEWDVEIEDQGVYRLCKVGKDWFLAGEYD